MVLVAGIYNILYMPSMFIQYPHNTHRYNINHAEYCLCTIGK